MKESRYKVNYFFCPGTDQDLENYVITDVVTKKTGNYYFDSGENMTRDKAISIFIEDQKNGKV